jgi:hypothetical protein
MTAARGSRKILARRMAMIMAAVGALLVSSGIASMASPTPANAGDNHNDNDKVVVCKYVGKPGESRLQGGGNPEEVSVSSLKRTLNDLVPPWDGTFPVAWTDAQGQAGGGSIAVGYVGEVAPDLSSCPGHVPDLLQAEAVANPVPPTCAANVPSYSTVGSVGVASWEESAAPAFGTTLTLTAHAAPGYVFGESPTTTVLVELGPAASGCGGDETVDPPVTVVSPPEVPTTKPAPEPATTATSPKAEAVVPTVVEAGLAGTAASPGEAGLGLVVTGLLLLCGAAGIARRGRRTTA